MVECTYINVILMFGRQCVWCTFQPPSSQKQLHVDRTWANFIDLLYRKYHQANISAKQFKTDNQTNICTCYTKYWHTKVLCFCSLLNTLNICFNLQLYEILSWTCIGQLYYPDWRLQLSWLERIQCLYLETFGRQLHIMYKTNWRGYKLIIMSTT